MPLVFPSSSPQAFNARSDFRHISHVFFFLQANPPGLLPCRIPLVFHSLKRRRDDWFQLPSFDRFRVQFRPFPTRCMVFKFFMMPSNLFHSFPPLRHRFPAFLPGATLLWKGRTTGVPFHTTDGVSSFFLLFQQFSMAACSFEFKNPLTGAFHFFE